MPDLRLRPAKIAGGEGCHVEPFALAVSLHAKQGNTGCPHPLPVRRCEPGTSLKPPPDERGVLLEPVAQEEIEKKRLQKLKLVSKDRIYAILAKYRKSA